MTVVPVLLGAYWILLWNGAMWRRFIWGQIGAEIRTLAGHGEIRGTWTGWQVEPGGEVLRVVWCAGLTGPRTHVWLRDGERRAHAGLRVGDELVAPTS